jgi:hypothetical protein
MFLMNEVPARVILEECHLEPVVSIFLNLLMNLKQRTTTLECHCRQTVLGNNSNWGNSGFDMQRKKKEVFLRSEIVSNPSLNVFA